VNVGSIAIKKFIEKRQPMLTLHGHVHESTTLTGDWKDRIGNTICFNGATEKKNLSLISFYLSNISEAKRELL
jgi:Icc-related predicted phosphoesterase